MLWWRTDEFFLEAPHKVAGEALTLLPARLAPAKQKRKSAAEAHN
jgi:hypothetical protein